MVKQVIVMRKDLGMRKGKMIAQGAHASLKVILDLGNTYYTGGGWLGKKKIGFDIPYPHLTDEMVEWIDGKFTKICVSVDSLEHLCLIYKEAQEAELPVALIKDAGLTEFKEPTYTCLAIGPAEASRIDKITGSLKLL